VEVKTNLGATTQSYGLLSIDRNLQVSADPPEAGADEEQH
jgi:hypothetical protein